MDRSLPASSVHGILQERILELVTLPSPGDSPNPGMEPAFPALASRFFTAESLLLLLLSRFTRVRLCATP